MQARPQRACQNPQSRRQQEKELGLPQLYGGRLPTKPLTPPMDIIGALSVILIARVAELSLWDLVRDRRSPV